MATAQQLKALLQSYSEADGEMFVSVALARTSRAVRLGRSHGVLIAFLVPFLFLFVVAGGCYTLVGPRGI
jgi:hypothetical protein